MINLERGFRLPREWVLLHERFFAQIPFPFPFECFLWNALYTCNSFGDHAIHNTVFPGLGYFRPTEYVCYPEKWNYTHSISFHFSLTANILTPHYIVKHPKLHCRGCDTFCFAYLLKERCFEEYREKSLRHVAMVAKFQEDNKLKTSLKKWIPLFQTSLINFI